MICIQKTECFMYRIESLVRAKGFMHASFETNDA